MAGSAFGHHPEAGLALYNEWSAPNPRTLPQWRRQLAAVRRDPRTIANLAMAVAKGKGSVFPSDPNAFTPQEWAAHISHLEAERLDQAELYYTTAEATRLAVSLAANYLGDALLDDEAPARAGFMVFEEPIGTVVNSAISMRNAIGAEYSRDRMNVHIVAASWGPYRDETATSESMWMTFWSPADLDREVADYLAQMAAAGASAPPREYLRVHLEETVGPLHWDNEMFLPYGADPAVLAGKFTYHWMCVVRAAWTLMDSPGIIGEEQLTQPKTDFKREQRENPGRRRSPATVRVVSLRRRQTTGAPVKDEQRSEHGQRSYAVRWPVRGHLRWQPVGPGRQERKRIYIEPHLKGPEDAPLKVPTETVHLIGERRRDHS